MSDPTMSQIKDTTANPAPLGLMGFGMTTVLLNFHNAIFYELNSMILAMGLCYGGLCAGHRGGIIRIGKRTTPSPPPPSSPTAFLAVTGHVARAPQIESRQPGQ